MAFVYMVVMALFILVIIGLIQVLGPTTFAVLLVLVLLYLEGKELYG